MSGTEPVGYDRDLLVECVVYHCPLEDSSCRCGWGSHPRHLGRSHAEHVANVYELRARGALLMGRTRHETLRHLTRDTFTSLCGRRLATVTTRFDTGELVPFAPHWEAGTVLHDGGVCETCRGLAEARPER